jgi:hypothetical protein
MTMPLPHPSYASEAGWRCIDALLPEAIRLDPANKLSARSRAERLWRSA